MTLTADPGTTPARSAELERPSRRRRPDSTSVALSRVERTLAIDRATRRMLAPSGIGLGLLYVACTAVFVLQSPADQARILAPFSAGSSVFFFGLGFFAVSGRIPTRLATALSFLAMGLVGANIFLGIAVTTDPILAIGGIPLLIGAAAIILDQRWLVAFYICFLPILLLTGALSEPGESPVWIFTGVTGLILGFVIQASIRRLILRHTQMRAKDRRRRIELHQALDRAELLRERLESAMLGANDGIWDWDLRSNTLRVSNRWNGILGLDSATTERSIEEWSERVHAGDRDRVELAVRDHIAGGSPHLECSYRLQTGDGGYRVVLMRGQAHKDERGRPVRMTGLLTDLTHTARHDPLTGLPGRGVLVERIRLAILRLSRHQEGFAVLHVDLGKLAEAGEDLGHSAREQFLVAATERLEAHLRSNDLVSRWSAVSRTGGDQFTLLIEGVVEESEAREVARRVRSIFEEPFAVGEALAKADLVLGIALSGEGDAEDYLRRAAIAARHARRSDERWVIFDPSLETGAQERVVMESALRQAIAGNQLCVHYQPVLNLETSQIEGVEALVRWHHPERGLVSPGEFIPVAERSDLIVDLDLFVLEEAVHEAGAWSTEERPLTLHVNVSPKTYVDERFEEQLRRLLSLDLVAPHDLAVEITESLLMERSPRTEARRSALRELGVRIAVDDFGTGYSSLARIEKDQLDILKIDRSFLSPDAAADSWRLVRTIVSLGQHFGLTVVAEGVETAPQVEALRDAGCSLAQGFLFSKPIAANELSALLRATAAGTLDERLPAAESGSLH